MEKAGKKVSKRGIVKRIVLAVFCALIMTGVGHVLFDIYKPGQNSINALSSVCMDVICLIILVILIGSFAFGRYEINQTTKLFLCLLLATVWALYLDFLNWAFDGSLDFNGLTYWFTVGSLCMGAILACIFTLYIYSYMVKNHGMKVMHLSARICAIVDVISFFVTLALAFTKTAFTFVDGHYKTGILYDVVTAVPVLSLLYITIVVAKHAKKVGIHDVLTVAGYILFMIFGALIEGEYSIGTTYVAVAIADLFIFVMLQNEMIALERQNVEKWIRKSNTDELTGIKNRHAYEEELTALTKGGLKDSFVYVSIDVNGLKNVNDTMGHTAGDKIIIGAAQSLKQCFSAYGKLFRIGGDEFAALINAEEGQLENIKKDVQEAIEKWSQKHEEKLTVSCGYVSAREVPEKSVHQMAILADKRMYEAKALHYQESGIERRKIN